MNTSLMGFLIALVVAALLVFPLSKALRAHPGAFYIGALAITALYVWAIWTGQNLSSIRGLCMVLQKGYLASILLMVVMFTGCFDEGTAIRKRLQPIRGELSILSFILILGHLCMYLPGYLRKLGLVFSTHTNVGVSIIIALVLTALFALLAILSFRFVRKHMNVHVWKAIQRLSYVMMALYVVHVGFVLGGSAFASSGVTLATVSFVVYVALVAVYAILRVRKAVRDAQKRQAKAAVAEAA